MPCEIQAGGGIKNLRRPRVIPYRYKLDNSRTDWKAGHIAADIGRNGMDPTGERGRMRAKRDRKPAGKLYEIGTQWG